MEQLVNVFNHNWSLLNDSNPDVRKTAEKIQKLLEGLIDRLPKADREYLEEQGL